MKNKIIPIIAIFVLLCSCASKENNKNNFIEGKVEQDQLSVVSKLAGRILDVKVAEGDEINAGDTLIILDIPEVAAKKEQALGALESAEGQYNMAKKGATERQIIQLKAKVAGLKEQMDFAEKSTNRLKNLLADSLIPQQKYDEVYAKYQGARNQYIAAAAELEEASHGTRSEQQQMAKGQKARAIGALNEVGIAEGERFIKAPQKLTVQSISLKQGEMALPGYTLVSGFLPSTTYFRFTIPEKHLSTFKKGETVDVFIPYNNQPMQGTIVWIKPLSAYANITSAYPDFEQGQALYEIKVVPKNIAAAEYLVIKSTVQLQIHKQ